MALFKHLSFIRANKGIVGWVYSMKCLLQFHEDLDGSSIAEQIEHWTCNSEALTASWNCSQYVRSSNSSLACKIASWFASSQLGFLTLLSLI